MPRNNLLLALAAFDVLQSSFSLVSICYFVTEVGRKNVIRDLKFDVCNNPHNILKHFLKIQSRNFVRV